MANLYKKPVVITDPKTGERIKTKSKKWWGRFRDETGVERRVPLATDKSASQTMLNALVVKAERRASGLEDPFEDHRTSPLDDHVEDFRQFLVNKGSTDDHVKLTVQRIRHFVAACAFKRIDHMTADSVQQCLADLRASGLSITSSNHYLRALKTFTRWLVRSRRAAEDRLAGLSLQNNQTDIRRERRTLSPEELGTLLDATRRGPQFRSMSGEDRCVLYLVALNTGLRAGELASLTAASFQLDVEPPTVTVQAAYSVSGRLKETSDGRVKGYQLDMEVARDSSGGLVNHKSLRGGEAWRINWRWTSLSRFRG